MSEVPRFRYQPTLPDGREAKHVATTSAGGQEQRYLFHGRLEIGRDDGARPEEPGVLLVPDPTVSRSHCIVTQRGDGRCFVRDVSRNGTRIGGKRLIPNTETEWHVGEAMTVGKVELVLIGPRPVATVPQQEVISTIPQGDRAIATVLVGDIRDYTVLVRTALSEGLQRSVSRVFETLAAAVAELDGTVKEYQGDAILAFWEGDASGRQALKACKAALELDALVQRMATDPSVWALPDVPLKMEWALATGLILLDSVGRGGTAGLSMMGEPVVRAFRMEKFATDETGRILACGVTHDLAAKAFDFRDLGAMTAKGFDRPDRVFALVGVRDSTGRSLS